MPYVKPPLEEGIGEGGGEVGFEGIIKTETNRNL